MILPIVRYGHPVLRQKGARVQEVNREVRQLAADMFETMYDAQGIGLAAQQVARPLQLAVIDVRGIEDRPSTLFIDGAEVEVASHMPLVLINPVVKPLEETVAGPEGCLSFPEIYAEITRAAMVDVEAQDLEGRTQRFRCGGLLAKAVQHEVDHLNGVLFIDRMSRGAKADLKDELEELMRRTKEELK